VDRHKLIQIKDQVDELLRHGSFSCVHQAKNIMAENFEAIVNFAIDLTEPKPKSKHTIADNYPAGGLTASEPCMFCENYEQLQTELDKHHWIPVSDRLPVLPLGPPNTSSEEVWLVFKGKPQVGYYTNFDGWRVNGLYFQKRFNQYDITHWKPIILPEKTTKRS